jgi:anti-sigma B factor antagonist
VDSLTRLLKGVPVLEPASVRTLTDERTPVVVATGEIDMASAPMLEHALQQAIESSDGPVVLDLCEVTFFDSSGLRTAIVAHRELDERGRRLGLAVVRDGYVWRTLSLAGVVEILNLYPSREAALADLRRD